MQPPPAPTPGKGSVQHKPATCSQGSDNFQNTGTGDLKDGGEKRKGECSHLWLVRAAFASGAQGPRRSHGPSCSNPAPAFPAHVLHGGTWESLGQLLHPPPTPRIGCVGPPPRDCVNGPGARPGIFKHHVENDPMGLAGPAGKAAPPLADAGTAATGPQRAAGRAGGEGRGREGREGSPPEPRGLLGRGGARPQEARLRSARSGLPSRPGKSSWGPAGGSTEGGCCPRRPRRAETEAL